MAKTEREFNVARAASRRKPETRVIACDADVRMGVRALRRKCALIRRAHDLAGDPPLRRFQPGFEGLARIITGQQLSVASAGAIWTRVSEGLHPVTPAAVLAAGEQRLRGFGLSRPKVSTLQAAARAVDDGTLDLDGLGAASDAAIRESLTAVKGIGPWTADIYLMFYLGRADAFASGDLALQVAVQMLAGADERLTAAELEALAESWRPWRAVAARQLWAYYKIAKESRSGVPV
jgi:DNA-3-methyladenine glycosylase II